MKSAIYLAGSLGMLMAVGPTHRALAEEGGKKTTLAVHVQSEAHRMERSVSLETSLGSGLLLGTSYEEEKRSERPFRGETNIQLRSAVPGRTLGLRNATYTLRYITGFENGSRKQDGLFRLEGRVGPFDLIGEYGLMLSGPGGRGADGAGARGAKKPAKDPDRSGMIVSQRLQLKRAFSPGWDLTLDYETLRGAVEHRQQRFAVQLHGKSDRRSEASFAYERESGGQAFHLAYSRKVDSDNLVAFSADFTPSHRGRLVELKGRLDLKARF